MLNGGTGNDTVTYSDSQSGVIVSLLTGLASGGDATGDVLIAVENLHGSAVADRLAGDASANELHGNGGDDTLRGRGGADQLEGGRGADIFIYESTADSLIGAANRDTIHDFNGTDGDLIDLSAIDADTGTVGNQSFRYTGQDGFDDTAGELIVVSDGDGRWLVTTDVDGDSASDMTILVLSDRILVEADFIL